MDFSDFLACIGAACILLCVGVWIFGGGDSKKYEDALKIRIRDTCLEVPEGQPIGIMEKVESYDDGKHLVICKSYASENCTSESCSSNGEKRWVKLIQWSK